MMRQVPILAVCLIVAILVNGVSAAVYATDNSFTVSLKYNNGEPTVSETFMRVVTGKPMAGEMELLIPIPDPEKELINQIRIVKDGSVKTKNLQTAPVSNVYVSSPSEDVVDVSQTTTAPGYPVLELYWDYDKSPTEPWRYYLKVDNLNDGYATLSNFRTSVVWRKPMTAQRVQDIINSGTIPAWETMR